MSKIPHRAISACVATVALALGSLGCSSSADSKGPPKSIEQLTAEVCSEALGALRDTDGRYGGVDGVGAYAYLVAFYKENCGR